MPIVQVGADGGNASVKEDYPWRAISLADTSLTYMHTTAQERVDAAAGNFTSKDAIERWQNQGIVINPASCLMGGLDVTAKIPICGLGIPFILSELDFVWLAVYFDSNLRPIHAGIQKGARFSRWYEYGGISMGGFPRSIKTVRRDHIGVDMGAQDADGFVRPDVYGPEWDYIAHELEKEIEVQSPYGFLDIAGTTLETNDFQLDTLELNNHYSPQAGSFDMLKRALRSELTYFMQDPTQVKQFAAYTLLGYCTSDPPAKDYPYPNVKLKKKFTNGQGVDTELVYYYRQVTKEHLMLQEINAGGVRAFHIVPGFAPYLEALPHPVLTSDAGDESFGIKASDGVEGTLEAPIINDAAYVGSEKEIGQSRAAADSPNVKSKVPLPGENSIPTTTPMGVIGAKTAGFWYKNSKAPAADKLDANKKRFIPPWQSRFDSLNKIKVNDWDPGGQSFEFYLSKGGCLDSRIFKVTNRADDPKQIEYVQEDGTPINWFKI